MTYTISRLMLDAAFADIDVRTRKTLAGNGLVIPTEDQAAQGDHRAMTPDVKRRSGCKK